MRMSVVTAALIWAATQLPANAEPEPAGPGAVQIQLGNATGTQHSLAWIGATLSAHGAAVVETSNTLTVPSALGASAGSCSANNHIGKSMLVSLVSRTESSTTIRVQLIPYENDNPIPDGFLYQCAILIPPTAAAGTSGGDGFVVVEPGDIIPGDLNGDGAIDVGDLESLHPLPFRPHAGGAADVNDDTAVSAGDIVALIARIGLP